MNLSPGVRFIFICGAAVQTALIVGDMTTSVAISAAILVFNVLMALVPQVKD